MRWIPLATVYLYAIAHVSDFFWFDGITSECSCKFFNLLDNPSPTHPDACMRRTRQSSMLQGYTLCGV